LSRLNNAVAAALLATLLACGGGNNGGSTPPSTTPPPGGSTQNPCTTAALEEGLTISEETPVESGFSRTPLKNVPDGATRWRVLDDLWAHRAAVARGTLAPLGPLPITEDIGDIAVLQDEGDLVLRPNQLDIRNIGLRWTRNAAGGYDVRKIDAAFRPALGNRVTLQDDDSASFTVPFTFQFYGRNQTQAFVNSDGNVTFEEEDRASTERNITRLLTGPPRAAPLLADLDPTQGAGRVFVNAAADQFTVTWCRVQGFESQRFTTMQVSLLTDGTIEMKYADSTSFNLLDGIVGLSPGRTGTFAAIDLSADGPTSGGAAAVGERFAQRGQLDTVAVARKFFRTHADAYDQLVLFTDQRLLQDSFAYETTVANEVRGIGVDVYDISRDFGSGGALRSIAVMDALEKYPADPTQKFLGENSTLSVLGQEVGHRWLAFMRFRDASGRSSNALLGRGQAHWSFFFDSDASVMEGNDIEDRGGGSFRTVDAVRRYSALDQYAMGLLRDVEVPPFFYVESPTNIQPNKVTEDGPQIGVTFNGTRRDVLIQDIIAVHGPRQPSAADSPRVHRQAFIYVVTGATTNQAEVAKLDGIRRQWEAFFLQATGGRMRAETRLRTGS
jgi:hypothetical protein